MRSLPSLSLSLGQMTLALNYGQTADARFKNRVRYLKLLGIPLTAQVDAPGRGNRARYDFFDLIETGFGMTGLGMGFRPNDIIAVLVGQRAELRTLYSQAWLAIPEGTIGQPWVKSRGAQKLLLDAELYLMLHDRHAGPRGMADLISQEEATEEFPVLEAVERYTNEPMRRLIPVKRMMLQWVAWAHDVPELKPGRK